MRRHPIAGSRFQGLAALAACGRGLHGALMPTALRRAFKIGGPHLGEIRAMQLDETRRIVLLTAVPQVAVAASLRFMLPDNHYGMALSCLFFAVALPATTATVLAAKFPNLATPGRVVAGHRIASLLAFLLGMAWSILPLVFLSAPGRPHMATVVATIAGLISIVYVIGPILTASMLFMSPIVCGTFLGLCLGGDGDAPTICVLLLIYAVFTVACRMLMNGVALERYEARIEAREREETIALLLRDFEADAGDWLWQTDRSGRLSYVPPRFLEVTGLDLGHALGLRLSDLFVGADGTRGDWAVVTGALSRGEPFSDRVVEVRLPDRACWWKLTGRPIDGPDGWSGFRGVATDVTEARAAARRISDLAERDHLTGLANRSTFVRLVEDALRACPSAASALFYIDLDDFKGVNDDGGHAAGDRVLKIIAQRLSSGSPQGAIAARLSGDEFAVWLEGDEAAALASARRLALACAGDIQVGARSYGIGASVGIALRAPDEGRCVEELLSKADMALYDAKALGKRRCRIFEPAIEEALLDKRALEADLSVAVLRGEFELHFQPLVSSQTGGIEAMEALLRWNSPSRGVVAPGVFIPVLERSDLILPVGRWVLAEACRQAARWPGAPRVSVNVSPRQFRQGTLAIDVMDALRASGLPASRLEIEITEGVLLEEGEVHEVLRALRKLGVKVAIDDFGTGFSSFGYICRYKVDRIKIDQSFVRDAHERDESRAVVEAIVALSRSLAIKTTAEGVETEHQASYLRRVGCDELQGYLFSRPLPADQAMEFLERFPSKRGARGTMVA